MSLKKLSPSSARRISSSEVITSVYSAVKELVENAVDSGAKNIEVKLCNYGLDRIEVQDNGCGVPISHVEYMCLPHHTSKITEFSDLGTKLETYGFRGEALSSLCNVADVTITTRTSEDEYASVFTFDKGGKVLNVNPSHFGKGTTVAVLNIFSNMPVRRQFISTSNKSKTELQRTGAMVKNLAIINPTIDFSFCHNKLKIWQKSHAETLKDSVKSVLGYSVSTLLEEVSTVHKKSSVILLLPKKYCKGIALLCSASVDSIRIFINQRPVRHKKLQKIIMKCITEHFGNSYPKGRYPTCVVNIKVAPCDVDVNIEPNKTKVICLEEDQICGTVEKLLEAYYKPVESTSCVKRPRLEEGLCTKQSTTSIKELSTNTLKTNFLLTFNHDKSNSIEENRVINTSVVEQLPLPVENNEDLCVSSDVPMDMWSRGCIKSMSGDVIEGGALMVIPKNNSCVESLKKITQMPCSESSAIPTNRKDKVKIFNSSFHSVSSQMGRKEMAGFTNFCRIMRPKILLEMPGMCFTSVAKVLSKKWKTLSNEEQDHFARNVENVKSVPVPQVHIREQSNNSIPNMFEKTALSVGKNTSKNSPSWYIPVPKNVKGSLKSTTWNVSETSWKIAVQPKINEVESTKSANVRIELLHQLSTSGVWLCKQSQQIGIIRHWNFLEKFYYNRLMRNHSVPAIPLDKPMLIKEDDFEPELWQSLRHMETESINTNTCQIICPLLLKNGLKLFWKEGELYLVHVASTIRYYGKDELREILTLMKKSSDLSRCRPVKIAAYLESEAVSLTNKKRSTIDKEKLTKLIESCDIKNELCLHQKPIFQLLYTLPDKEFKK